MWELDHRWYFGVRNEQDSKLILVSFGRVHKIKNYGECVWSVTPYNFLNVDLLDD